MRGASWQVQRRALSTRLRSVGRGLVCVSLAAASLGPGAGRARATGNAAHSPGEDPVAREVERLAADANAAYKVYDFQRAAELLERAYQLRQVPALLYNLAKAYDRLGSQDKAIELYRRYVDSGDPDLKLRGRAQARIQQFEDARPRPEPRPDPVEPRPRVSPRPAAWTAPVIPGESEEERRLRVWKADRTRARRNGLALGSVGGVLALGGVGLSVSALLLRNRYAASLGLEAEKRHQRDSARTQAISADALFGVAAVLGGVGIYYLWRGYHREAAPGRVAWLPLVAPMVSRETAGLVVGGAF